MKTLCGIDCSECFFNNSCNGCCATNGNPFGKGCLAAECIKNKRSSYKEELIEEINNLNIEGIGKITEVFSIKGSFVNLSYSLLNKQQVKLLDDDRIYLGCQVNKIDSDRFVGICADEKYIIVSEYGENGTNPEIIMIKKRRCL